MSMLTSNKLKLFLVQCFGAEGITLKPPRSGVSKPTKEAYCCSLSRLNVSLPKTSMPFILWEVLAIAPIGGLSILRQQLEIGATLKIGEDH